MSYLDVPRIHFSGRFFADPSTVNNLVANYGNATPAPGWNASGQHRFSLDGCRVQSAVDGSGNEMTTPAQDPLIGTPVESTTNPIPARLVDLDPEEQQASQIWGLAIKIGSAGSGEVTGTMNTGTLRDLWRRAPLRYGGPMAAASGSYQSTIASLGSTFPVSGESAVLRDLSSSGALAIKFVLHAYDPLSSSPGFTSGRIVGTIGPRLIGPGVLGEEEEFLDARVLEPQGIDLPDSPFGRAPFLVDAARSTLVVDLGNAIPESAPGVLRTSLGTMKAFVGPADSPTELGVIDCSQSRFDRSAGVVELPLSVAKMTTLGSSQLKIQVSGGTGPSGIVLAEDPTGSLMASRRRVLRMDPGTTLTVTIVARRFGQPVAVPVNLRRVGDEPASGLQISPANGTTSSTSGLFQATLTAANPGNPRGAVDGQLYMVEFRLGADSSAPRRGLISVRVFDSDTLPANPRWDPHVRQVLRDWAPALYPAMRPHGDLSDYTSVHTLRYEILKAIRRPLEDPRYMPVTRDLSRDKKALLLRWIGQGAPR